MKLSSNFTTEILDLSEADFRALSDLDTTAYLAKTITLNVGTKIGDNQVSPEFIENQIVAVIQSFREDIRHCGGRIFMDDVTCHHHTNKDGATIVKGVPIEETTLQVTFVGNLALNTIKALVLAICYATGQEAIPALVEARYKGEGQRYRTNTASFGLMVGQTLAERQKWGVFNPKFFIK